MYDPKDLGAFYIFAVFIFHSSPLSQCFAFFSPSVAADLIKWSRRLSTAAQRQTTQKFYRTGVQRKHAVRTRKSSWVKTEAGLDQDQEGHPGPNRREDKDTANSLSRSVVDAHGWLINTSWCPKCGLRVERALEQVTVALLTFVHKVTVVFKLVCSF